MENQYLDTAGNPALHTDEFSRWRARHDELGRQIELTFFGRDGHPALRREGMAQLRTRFDAQGNELEKSYFGIEGQPVMTGSASLDKQMEPGAQWPPLVPLTVVRPSGTLVLRVRRGWLGVATVDTRDPG